MSENDEKDLIRILFNKFFTKTASEDDYVVCYSMHKAIHDYLKNIGGCNLLYDEIGQILNELYQLDDTIVTKFDSKCYTKVKFKPTKHYENGIYSKSYSEKYL